jgi:hypothetical protein
VGRFLQLPVLCGLIGLSQLMAQNTPQPAAAPAAQAPAASTKPGNLPPRLAEKSDTQTFQLKYIDPERLRDMFSGRSFVMEADRDLKTLTAHGPPAFLKEVEDSVKRFDVPAPPPANLQITVYLLTGAAQAPTGTAVPAELAAIGKELPAAKLADSQMIRIREGLGGEAAGVAGTGTSARLARVRLQAAYLTPGPKGDEVSINGLQVWLDVPSVPPATTPPPTIISQSISQPDVAVDLDLQQNQPAEVARIGLEKPVVVVVKAAVVP